MSQVDTPGEKPVIDIAVRRLMEGTPKIELTAAFPCEGPFEVQLPIWRPGRYEVGNFARYVYDMMGQQSDGSWIELQKTSLHAWHVPEEIGRVRWTFFADLFNAGSTGVAEDILYINPVNCFLYLPGSSGLGVRDRTHRRARRMAGRHGIAPIEWSMASPRCATRHGQSDSRC